MKPLRADPCPRVGAWLRSLTAGPANDPGEPNGQFAPLGQRPWAVQSHAGKLYYSVGWAHSQSVNPTENNEVWSVAYVDDDVSIAGTIAQVKGPRRASDASASTNLVASCSANAAGITPNSLGSSAS